jgi:cell wall-associated NlpC family hydrolase
LNLPQYLGIIDDRRYSRIPTDASLYNAVAKVCKRIVIKQAGCAILFKFPGVDNPQHFAIYTERGTIIHANAQHGKVVEQTFGAPWTRLVHSLWLIPGVKYE